MVVDGYQLDDATAIWSRARREKKVPVGPNHTIGLKPPPARCMVVSRATLGALHHHVSLVVWENGKTPANLHRVTLTMLISCHHIKVINSTIACILLYPLAYACTCVYKPARIQLVYCVLQSVI